MITGGWVGSFRNCPVKISPWVVLDLSAQKSDCIQRELRMLDFGIFFQYVFRLHIGKISILHYQHSWYSACLRLCPSFPCFFHGLYSDSQEMSICWYDSIYSFPKSWDRPDRIILMRGKRVHICCFREALLGWSVSIYSTTYYQCNVSYLQE